MLYQSSVLFFCLLMNLNNVICFTYNLIIWKVFKGIVQILIKIRTVIGIFVEIISKSWFVQNGDEFGLFFYNVRILAIT